MRWVAVLSIALGIALGIAPARAAPQVEIRAYTKLALSRVRLLGDGQIEVSGQLVDKLTGEGLANQHVYVTVAGQRLPATTAQDGSFRVTTLAEPGPQPVVLEFKGGDSLAEAQPLSVSADPAKEQLVLSIAKLGDDPTGARIQVTALGDDGTVEVPVALAVAETGQETWRPLRTARTGQELVISRKDAGGPGMHRIRATFAGDDRRQKQTAELALELSSSTTTSMHVRSTHLAYEDDLAVSGLVTDDDDRPVARAAVTLTSGDRRLAQGTTDDHGRYAFEIEASIVADTPVAPGSRKAPTRDGSGSNQEPSGERQVGIQVQADPGAPFVRPSRSQPEVIVIAAPQPVPVSYTVVAFLATALAAGGFFAARGKPWRKLRRPAPPAEVPSQEGEREEAQGGLVVARPSIVSTLRRPSDDGFSGVVRDTVRGRPVADAVVRLVGATEREVRTGADGAFALEGLAAGEWSADVAAPGHLTSRFAVTIPHRGELRGVRVDLVPVRERVFQLYRRAAEPILPEPRLWGIWSPRQIVDHVRSKRPSPALAELTDFVEELYFSPRLAEEAILTQASERVDRAIHERARPR